MKNKNISYLAIMVISISLLSTVITPVLSSSSPDTTVNFITPYHIASPSLQITATNTTPVDNITLYYRYSATNYSDWSPGKDYAILAPGDYKTKADDPNIDYPQRMWYDEKNQLLYVVSYLKSNLQIWDVSNSENILKQSQLKHSVYLDHVHDVVVVNNWSYDGINYGNIAFTVGHGSPMYLSSIRVNLSASPVFLQNFPLQTSVNSIEQNLSLSSKMFKNDYFHSKGGLESYTKLGYITVIQRGNCLYAVVTRLSGKFNIFNASDPTHMVNISYICGTDIDPDLTNWWIATVDPTNQYLYVCGIGVNKTITTFDVSDISNPRYIGYQIHQTPNQDDFIFRYYDRKDLNRLYSINGSDISTDRSLVVFDVSDPENWQILAESGDTQGTGEFQTDFWTNDWAASRKWIPGGGQTGIIVWNIRNVSDIYNAGSFSDIEYTNHSHMQWFDYNHSRIFVLAYGLNGGGNSIYIVKWQISLAQESSWYKYEVDTSAPWSWDFNFPYGKGYYEFCCIGRKTGQSPETFPVGPDAICHFSTFTNNPPVFGSPTPMNNSLNQALSVVWSIPIMDFEGDAFYWSIECNNGQTSTGTGDGNGSKTLMLSTLAPSTTYKIWVNATDSTGSGIFTRDWYTFTTQQEGNVPPNKPNKPAGNTSGKLRTPYTYSTFTIDLNGDDVYYLWDWGDGSQSNWLGPYNSGDLVTETHTWKVKTSSIKVKAKDSSGVESPWSDPLPISMPKGNAIIFRSLLSTIFQILIERFSYLFPVLHQWVGY
ncbi:MAG: hypothetical protein JW840_08835 [Candidatus Thermoplasmatota archaeon]|nr:hypothetical protein [Candidatus Thermoplasmatota archaeon]